jgi:hypothetical protein
MPKLTLSDGLDLERDISLLQAGQIISFLGTGESLAATDGEIRGSEAVSIQHNLIGASTLNPIEILHNSNAKTNAEKITVFGYIVTINNTGDGFTQDEVRDLFRRLGEPYPSNPSRDFKEAVRSAYIYPSLDSNSKYILSEKGRLAVTGGFKSDGVQGKKVRRKRSGVSTLKLEIRDGVKGLPVVSDLPGFAKLYGLETKGKQILWLLLYAKENGIDAVNYKEISHIAAKFRIDIGSKNFTASNEGNMKAGYVMKRGADFVLLQKGEEVLRVTA